MDDFGDGIKTGWMDFVTGLGGAVTEVGGALTLEVPAGLAGRPVFVSSAKASEPLRLQDGETVELRVDVAGASSPEAFAVLAWAPVSEPPAAFSGYFIAQSAAEIRVGKAVGRYFERVQPSPPLKSASVTLALSLSRAEGAVTLRAQVLDKLAGGAVLWERTFVDTPEADALAAGTDWPAAPWSGEGRYTLLAYTEAETLDGTSQSVTFDNAEVFAPAPANPLPWFHGIEPPNGASFQAGRQAVDFRATDDQSFEPGGFAYATGGPLLALAFGDANGDWTTVLASNVGDFKANAEYNVRLVAKDAQGASNTMTLRFDTFCAACPVMEAEDYNFGGGQFLDSPALSPEEAPLAATAYRGQIGQAEIDYHVAQPAAGGSLYRPGDPVRTRRSLDFVRPKFAAAGQAGAPVFDYDVQTLQAGDWLAYTRTFSETNYRVYLRQAVLNVPRFETILERLDGLRGPDANWTPLGRFIGENTGVEYRNVPLLTESGEPVVVEFGGPTTLRLRQVTSLPAEGAVFYNYLVFVPPAAQCTPLEFANALNGPWLGDWTATLDWEGRTLRAKKPTTAARFFRTNFEQQLRITAVTVVGDALVLRFEQFFP